MNVTQSARVVILFGVQQSDLMGEDQDRILDEWV